MNTSKLKKFAQYARRALQEQTEVKLKQVSNPESAARRENPKAIQALEAQIAATTEQSVIDKVAYTWFNRFCALRFMDVNRYNRMSVVSPVIGQSQPEILAEAKQGYFDDKIVNSNTQQQINALLTGQSPSTNPHAEVYRLLLVAACNHYHSTMPFLFEKIADFTELLLPNDLLSGNSILAYTREAMTPDVCKDVEVIGWLYQFYISEKKDEVFAALKKNKKITPNNIPAATQLFTPHWIVRYLIENSLGRLWMLNHPDSKLIEQMDYYIEPAQQEQDIEFLSINSPEALKICDPACGSGHMLTYAFDLLYAIYEEQGYSANEIPKKILTHNLYGIEIDQRAGELAAFALTMKARSKYRRFLRKPIQPNICVLKALHIEEQDLDEYMNYVGNDLFTTGLRATLTEFKEANNFGSLIRPSISNVDNIVNLLEAKNVSGQLLLAATHKKVLAILKQADYLSQKYQVVIANPPYMGSKGMNSRLKKWAAKHYKASKSDLFAMFMERNLALTVKQGLSAMITMQSWMFLSSFEKLRTKILDSFQINSLIQIGYNSFPELNSKIAQAAAFVLQNSNEQISGCFYNLNNAKQSENKDLVFRKRLQNPQSLYRVSASDFRKIPSNPIAYWVSDKLRKAFTLGIPLKTKGNTRQGMATSDNNRFLRGWFEVDINRIFFDAKNREDAKNSNKKWFPYNKGGAYRRWYGNCEYVINWEDNGEEVLGYAASLYGSPTRTIKSISEYFKPSISWSKVTSSGFSMRYFKEGFIFDVAGCSIFSDTKCDLRVLLCFTNSSVAKSILTSISPTLNFEAGQIALLPVFEDFFIKDYSLKPQKLINTAQTDWDSYEISWNFNLLPILCCNNQSVLKETYKILRTKWQDMIFETKQLEEKNNQIFIKAYSLQNELSSKVPLNEITLTCNPHYRYGGNKTEEELEALLLADTMREFISYAVGCMFGRYSLDKEGLILANQGEIIEDYFQKINTKEHADNTEKNTQDLSVSSAYSVLNPNSFPPDADNVIPILDGDWFTDDIADRFRKFLRVTFGDEHYEENLKFIEDAIGKDIRKFFLKEFYTDHLKRYKKRPIYWLFSSPKGSFNALIYMHRYQPDTVSVILNDYLREFRTKLEANKSNLEQISISTSASRSEKTKALKKMEKLRKIIDELNDYEHETLYPLATQKIEIDLDDGVKVNYNKFGKAMKKVAGLSHK